MATRLLGRRSALGLLVVTISGWPSFAQVVISARSGLIYYVEGEVFLDGRPVSSPSGTYQELKESSEVRTGNGRAELLLNPGVFLRLGENSAVRVLSNRVTETRLEFLSGAALVEPSGIISDKANYASSVRVAYGNTTVHFRLNGVYRFDAESASLRVYEGEADINCGNAAKLGRAGESIRLDAPAEPQPAEAEVRDSLELWSKSRAEAIAASKAAGGHRKTRGASWNPTWISNRPH